MNQLAQRRFLFHPATALVVSIIAAAIFALFIQFSFEGDFRWFLLYYFVPVAVPFVAFLFDRAEQYAQASGAAWAADLAVLIPALTRAFIRLPLISGHALFLSYALLTSRSKVARLTAFLVLMQVAYLKIFVTHDTALIGGIAVGSLTAMIYGRIKSAGRPEPLERNS